MRCITFFVLGLLLLSLSVTAISVVSDKLVNDTLELTVGSSKIYSIRLQNPTKEEANLRIDYDTVFLKVIDYKEVYNLPPMENSYRVLFNVTAPKKPGLYNVGYTVGEVEPSGGGGLSLRLKISKSFTLRVIGSDGGSSDGGGATIISVVNKSLESTIPSPTPKSDFEVDKSTLKIQFEEKNYSNHIRINYYYLLYSLITMIILALSSYIVFKRINKIKKIKNRSKKFL